MNNKQKINNRGFTLMEILVAMGIMILIISGITYLLSYSFKSRNIVWEQLLTQNQGRKITQDFINELRTANYSSLGAYPVELASAQEFIFFSNIDSDSWRERIRYYKSGTNLMKGITKPSGSPLSYNIATESSTIMVEDIANATAPLFYYYNSSYNGVTVTSSLPYPIDVTDIKAVKFDLYLEENPNATPAPFHIESMAGIRNLKTN